ncbi:MAG: radical SAM protein [Desulfopila sp.]|nr:radical SAM protein [Desulfopila sp.]
MGRSFTQGSVSINLEKAGADRYTKASYPLRYGHYSEIVTHDAIYHFHPGGEIWFARGRGALWPDQQEWLKRSAGNDWIYYSTGGYTGVFEAIGEYYLPNLQYPSNALIGGTPFAAPHVRRLINGWYEQLVSLRHRLRNAPRDVDAFLEKVLANGPAVLAEKARRLFQIGDGRVTVLPPDGRHVDYDIIPLNISTGCLYKCRFCKVKNKKLFRQREKSEIDYQLGELQELYGENLSNYNSIFLGEHDALCCRSELLLYSVQAAYEQLGFSRSSMRGANVFLFGSVDSFLACTESLLEDLNRLPVNVFINLGLESVDQKTLDVIGKPVDASRVEEAFRRMLDVNDRFQNIEVSANFLMDESLPSHHYHSFLHLCRDSISRNRVKGAIYLSPLRFGAPSRELLFSFNRLKLQSRLPTYLYIIQRL